MARMLQLGKSSTPAAPSSAAPASAPATCTRIDAPFYQAGLAGYSDAAMRLIARRHGCPYCVTEAMLDQFLIHGGKGLEAAELDEADHPIAGQLMGSHPQDIAQGAKILVSLGYDAIDVNLACPVKKIKKKCRGGHLLSVPDEAIAILDAVKQAVGDDRPCTVKLRRGRDDSPEAAGDFYAIFEAAIELGFSGATVHGRTVEQKYVGPSRWPFLRDLAERYRLGRFARPLTRPHTTTRPADNDDDPTHADTPFVLGGSGDVFSLDDIFAMLEQTGVDWVSVARGCIGNPWIFRQARDVIAGRTPEPPTIDDQRDVLEQHFKLSLKIHGEKRASRMMRKFGIKFSTHHPDSQAVKNAFIAVQSLDDWRAVLDDFYLRSPIPVG